MSSSTNDIAAIAPTTKRELAAWTELNAQQQLAARVIASTSDKLTAAVWKDAIEQAIASTADAAPTTKRESAAWAELSVEQQNTARLVALESPKLTAVVWRDAIKAVVAETQDADEPKQPSKTQLAKDAREAKRAQTELNAQTFGTFTIQDPATDDDLFAVVLNDTHVVYTATNRRYVEVVRAALADGLAAVVADALA